jgi:hypothetical protein
VPDRHPAGSTWLHITQHLLVMAWQTFNPMRDQASHVPNFRCFMGTDLDVLAIGSYYLVKENQDMTLALNYKNLYEPD